MLAEAVEIRPQPGPQEQFLATRADIAGFGGAAGGGKTYALLLESLRHSGLKGFGAVIFRRTSTDIRNEGGLWDTSRNLFAQLGARPREQFLDWTFPSGARIGFDGLQHESDVLNYQGSQIAFIGFDESTHFSAKQFWYMFSRNRTTCGIKPYIRLTFNPDPDSWVFDLFGPWVNPAHPKYGAQAGELRWFVRESDATVWVDEGTPNAKSITFIPATVYDNKILLSLNPEYLANLHALSELDKARLLYGLWSAVESKGALWKREWFGGKGYESFRMQRALYSAPHPTIPDREITKYDPPLNITQVVVALDPSVADADRATNAKRPPDECGICVAGTDAEGIGYVLADYTDTMSPEIWARLVVKLFDKCRANQVIAEVNQGGVLIRDTIRTVSGNIPITLVHASMGKRARAEPVALLYETGRVRHCGYFPKLEGQMVSWDSTDPRERSPGAIDALVWAFHGLGLCKATGTRTRDRIKDRG